MSTAAPRRHFGNLGIVPPSGGSQYAALVAPYQHMSPMQAAQLANQLGDFGVSAPPQLQQGVDAVNNLLPAAQSTIAAIKSGNVNGAIADATPLIAAGLAATGVGTVAIAAIAGGLEAFTAISSALGLFQPAPPQTCNYIVGDVCFSLVRPYGPTDPAWLTIEQYTSEADAGGAGWEILKGTASVAQSENWGERAFPWWWAVGAELYALGDRSIAAMNWASTLNGADPTINAEAVLGMVNGAPAPPGSNMAAVAAEWATLGAVGWDFCRTFDLAWIKMSEMYLNGYLAPSPEAFISSFIQAWNTVHSDSTQVVFTSTSQTFLGQILGGMSPTNVGGTVTQQQRFNPTAPVNVGGVVVLHAVGGAGKLTSSSAANAVVIGQRPMSLGKKIAIGAGITVGAAAVGVGAYSWWTEQSLSLLFGKATGAIGDLIGAEDALVAEEVYASAKLDAASKMRVQSLLFPRDEFSVSQARAWARRRGYRDSRPDITPRYIRLRQRDPAKFSTFRTVPLGDSGVKAVMAR